MDIVTLELVAKLRENLFRSAGVGDAYCHHSGATLAPRPFDFEKRVAETK
jgi:hypothetical protein